MREQIGGCERHAGAHSSSVPKLHPLSKDAVQALEKNTPFSEVSDVDELLTEKQRRRQAESLFRLQRLLDQSSANLSEDDEDESSADWSLEAVLDGASVSDSPVQSPNSTGSSSFASGGSPDNQDNFSVCTLDSELADSVQIGSKLCDKIRQVSGEKMFARLRRSFRKKEKCEPKVGIFMFVDNPLYVSPDVKKEAKIVTFTPGKRRSFRFKNKGDKGDKGDKSDKRVEGQVKRNISSWYVGNPMYNSPVDYAKGKNKSAVSLHTALCEKENIKNSKVIKPSVGPALPKRVPLGDLWIQTNPGYDSPNIRNNPRVQSPSRKKIDSPKRPKNKLLPVPPVPTRPEGTALENHYLTPILTKAPGQGIPFSRDNILDVQKFIDHEYCTIAGDDSDSWLSQSSASRKSDSPCAKRNLKFEGKSQQECAPRKASKQQQQQQELRRKALEEGTSKTPVTPSRIWRQDSKSHQSTPRQYKGTLEKSLECQMPFGDRGFKTPRSIKRGKINKNSTKCRLPPDLPPNPAPPLPPFNDTNLFHHAAPQGDPLDTSFQLAPDSIYESLSFMDHLSPPSGPPSRPPSSPPSGPPSRPPSGPTSGICSSCSSSNRSCSCSSLHRGHEGPLGTASSSSGISSSYSKVTPRSASKRRTARLNSSKTGIRGSGLTPSSQGGVGNTSLRARNKRTPRKVARKYKAREVLQGKGQLKLAVYENFSLLTIHVIEARKLRSNFSSVCNPYVKISLVPDSLERTFCRTPLQRASNSPFFDQKFSFDFLKEDLDKRLLISLWSRDTLRKRSEFLGCMSFSVAHIISKRVSGWFRLLTEAVGRRKHFAVSLLNGSFDGSRKLPDVVSKEKPSVAEKGNECENLNNSPPQKHPMPEYQNCPRMTSPDDHHVTQTGQTPYTLSVNIKRTNEGFGFSVAWTRPPRVERVEPGKAADLAGLKTGDYIIFVGHQNVVKLDENAVLKVIRDSGGHLALEVYRRGVSRTPKTLLNGWARPPPLSAPDPPSNSGGYDAHLKRNKIGQVTFGNEVGSLGCGILI